MNKKILKTLGLMTALGLTTGMVVPVVTNCGNVIPDPTKYLGKMDGTDWHGYGGVGTLEIFGDPATKEAVVVSNDEYEAKDLIIPDQVKDEHGIVYDLTVIEENAFGGDEALSGDLTLPDSLKMISTEAFYGCENLNGTLKFGINKDSNVDILADAFYLCPFSKIECRSKNYHLADNLGKDCYVLLSKTKTYDFTKSSDDQIVGMLAGGHLDIKNQNIEVLGDSVFEDCTGFRGTLELPTTLKTIGESAFDNCYNLTGALNLPNKVESIGDYAFEDCTGLEGEITLPNSIRDVSIQCFLNTNLTMENDNGLFYTAGTKWLLDISSSYANRNIQIAENCVGVGRYACMNKNWSTAKGLTLTTGQLYFNDSAFDGANIDDVFAMLDYNVAATFGARSLAFTPQSGNFTCLGYIGENPTQVLADAGLPPAWTIDVR